MNERFFESLLISPVSSTGQALCQREKTLLSAERRKPEEYCELANCGIVDELGESILELSDD